MNNSTSKCGCHRQWHSGHVCNKEAGHSSFHQCDCGKIDVDSLPVLEIDDHGAVIETVDGPIWVRTKPSKPEGSQELQAL